MIRDSKTVWSKPRIGAALVVAVCVAPVGTVTAGAAPAEAASAGAASGGAAPVGAAFAVTVWPGDGALRTARPGPLKQFEQLVARMEDASAAYYEALDALEARAPDGRPAVHAIEDLPRDERPAILKQMDAVARAAAGTDDAAPLAVGVFSWALYIGDDLALTWLDTLARRYPDEPYLNEYLVDIPDLYRSAGSPEAWAKGLERLTGATRNRDTKAASLFASGQVLMELHRLPRAKAAFEQVIKVAPKSDLAAMARGMMFEIDHLQIGMVAPDFTGKTFDDKKTVSLSSLRGNVVLLHYWATW